MQEFFAVGGSLGSSRAVAAFRGVVAVGSSRGVVGVLMPRGLSADGHPSGQARVVQLGEASSEDRAVSSIAFSLQARPQHTFSMYVSAYTPNASAVKLWQGCGCSGHTLATPKKSMYCTTRVTFDLLHTKQGCMRDRSTGYDLCRL